MLLFLSYKDSHFDEVAAQLLHGSFLIRVSFIPLFYG